MKKKVMGILATLFFTLVSIIFVAPIFIVLINSMKSKTFINLETFKLPTEESYVGLENYKTAITQYDFLKAVGWTLFITVFSVAVILICCSMTAWFITRVKNVFTKMIYLLCVFSMVIPFQMVMFTLARTADTLKLNTPYTIPPSEYTLGNRDCISRFWCRTCGIHVHRICKINSGRSGRSCND